MEGQVFKKLVVDELHTSIEQQVSLFNPSTIVERVLPHLYIVGNPSGAITLTIESGEDVLASKTFTISAIVSEVGKTKNHFHGYVGFIFPSPIWLAAGSYTVKIESSSQYEFEENNFVGWVRLPTSNEPSILKHPLDLRLTEIIRR